MLCGKMTRTPWWLTDATATQSTDPSLLTNATTQRIIVRLGTIGLQRKEYLWLVRNTALQVQSPKSDSNVCFFLACQGAVSL